MGEAAGAPGRTGHSSRRYASPTKNASEIASRSKRGVRGQKFNVGGKACRLLFYRGRASGFQGAEPTGLPSHSTHWCRHGLAAPEPPIKGLASRFAGLWVVRDLIIIDDPLKLGDAMSEAVRARVIEWYRSTLLSRGDDKTTTRIVVVMQWVHQNDLVGYLQGASGFDVLNLPAMAQRPQTYDLGGGRTYTR
jgi:hypothetical protein